MRFTFSMFAAALGLTSASVTRELNWASTPSDTTTSFDVPSTYQVALNYQETHDLSDSDYTFLAHPVIFEANNFPLDGNRGDGCIPELTLKETSTHCQFLSAYTGIIPSGPSYAGIYVNITGASAYCDIALKLTPTDSDKLAGSIPMYLNAVNRFTGASSPEQAHFTVTAGSLTDAPSQAPNTAAPTKIRTKRPSIAPSLAPIETKNPTAAPTLKSKSKPNPKPDPKQKPGPKAGLGKTSERNLESDDVTRTLSWAAKPEGNVGPVSFEGTLTPFPLAVNYQESFDPADPAYVFIPHKVVIEARNLNFGGSMPVVTYSDASSHCDFLYTESGTFFPMVQAYTDIYFQVTNQSAYCEADLSLTPNSNDKLQGKIPMAPAANDFMLGTVIPALDTFTVIAINNPPSPVPTAAPFATKRPTQIPIAPTAAPVTKGKPKPKPDPKQKTGPGPAVDSTATASDNPSRHLRQAQSTPTESENSGDNGWISSVCGGYEGCVRALTSISTYLTNDHALQVDCQHALMPT